MKILKSIHTATVLITVLFFVASCSQQKQEDAAESYDYETIESTDVAENDDTPAFTVEKSKSGGYNVWSIKEARTKVSKIPVKKVFMPSEIREAKIIDSQKHNPSAHVDATWSAALRALNNLVPNPDDMTIKYKKVKHQINNDKECLFTGPVMITDENGRRVEAEFNITVHHFWNDPREPESFYCTGNIVF